MNALKTAGLVLLIVSSPVSPALCQTLFLDFNTPGQYTSNFNAWNDVSGANGGNYDFTECSSCGVIGSGAVSVFQSTDTTTTYKSGSWNFSTNGAALLLSTIIQANGQANTGSKIQLGFLNAATNGFYGNSGIAFESFRTVPVSSTVWSVREQYKAATGSTVETNLGNINLVIGRWYKLAFGMTNTAGSSGSFSSGFAIYDYGSDGITPGANLITFSAARTNAGLASITVPQLWPGIRAFQNAGIAAWDNFLVFVPSSKPLFTLGVTNTTVVTGNPASFKVLADGSGAISYSWFTNNTPIPGATNASYTSPPLNSSYTNITVVATNSNGSTTNSAALTVVTPTIAVVTNLPATVIRGTTAVLNGQVLNTGNEPPVITIYYGAIDGGTNPAAWAGSLALGAQSGAFSQIAVGLAMNTTYFFNAQAVNGVGMSWAGPSQSFTTLSANPISSVLTFHYDNTRQGQNTNECLLTPANVNTNSFGKLFSYTVDGYLYAEPLYVPNVAIAGHGVHNIVIAATENDSVYAFDADSNAGPTGGLLWETNLGIALISTNYGVRYHHNVLNPLIGITATPVVDPASGTLYVDDFTDTYANTNNGWHILHALNISNGTEQPFSPVFVSASVSGTGVGGANGVVPFNPSQHMNRPAMTLAGGILYVSYGSYGDTDPYHGWIIAYNATNLVQLTNYVFNSTPNATTSAFGVNAGEGALWMGGAGPCVDAGGNIYVEVANGSFSANTNGGDYGDSFVKLSTAGQLTVADYFTPADQASLAANDNDLGSGGPVVLPDSVGSAAHPHLLVGSGKEGTIFLVDRDNMGHFQSAGNACLQSFPGANFVIGDPAFFNNCLYYHGSGGPMSAFFITNAQFTPVPVARSSTTFGNSTTPVITANGSFNGIVWELQTETAPVILHAYDASSLVELYNSSQLSSRDNPGGAVKWTCPTVVNGKVYVGAQYTLSVFGSLIPNPPRITRIALNGPALTITATNGPANGSCVLLSGANVTTPLRLWTPILTNSFDGNGNLTFSTSISSTNAGQFFALRVP